MRKPRFYVVTLDAFDSAATGTRARHQRTCSVLDRAYCHREVARFEDRASHRTSAGRFEAIAAAAQAEAARLNAWNERELACF